jgi:hypothetical protein
VLGTSTVTEAVCLGTYPGVEFILVGIQPSAYTAGTGRWEMHLEVTLCGREPYKLTMRTEIGRAYPALDTRKYVLGSETITWRCQVAP